MNNEINFKIKQFLPPLELSQIKMLIETMDQIQKGTLTDSNFLLNPFLAYIIAYIPLKNDSIPVAFLQFTLIYDRIEIEQFYVKPAYRNKKLGTSLLSNLIDIATKKKCESISLEVNENNLIALTLYKKFGFQITAIRERYYHNKENAYLMLKEIGEEE